MFVFCNKKSEALAKEVVKATGAQLGEKEVKVFPDGETYVRILTKVTGKKAVVIHTTKNNDDLIELLFTLSALRDCGAHAVVCVIPHILYQRQDEAFKEGEAVSAKVILNIINRYADEIITVNAHFFDEGGKSSFGGVKVLNLDAFPLLGEHFKNVPDLAIIAPDEGAMHYAEAAGKAIGCPHDYLIKKRIDGETVEMQPKALDIKGRNVVILDDIISTGGTMIKAAEMLKKQGAKSVRIGCVHGLFTKGVDIFGKLDVVCTDSLPTKLSKVSLAPILIKALKA